MSPLGRDDALHLFPQRRNPGLPPCGGMGGEESLAGLPGDGCPVGKRAASVVTARRFDDV